MNRRIFLRRKVLLHFFFYQIESFIFTHPTIQMSQYHDLNIAKYTSLWCVALQMSCVGTICKEHGFFKWESLCRRISFNHFRSFENEFLLALPRETNLFAIDTLEKTPFFWLNITSPGARTKLSFFGYSDLAFVFIERVKIVVKAI